MPRRCECDRFRTNEEYTTDQCRLCWLYHNDERFRKKWDKPTLFQKVTGLTTAALEHLAAGCPKVTQDEHAARLIICRNCPLFNARMESCDVCGCNMPAKAWWAEQKCPEGKWHAASGTP